MRQRFVAGVVCPQCRALDRIVIESNSKDEAVERQRCVECGYLSARPGSGAMHAGIPRGRPEQLDTGPQNAPQPVRILDPEEMPEPRKPDSQS